MRRRLAAAAAALLLVACQPGPQDPAPIEDDPRLAALFAQDQAARRDGAVGLLEGMADAERQAEVRALLQRGQVRSGGDYWRAAFILHHGTEAEDFLLAHALATAALSQGHADAGWLAAATLDRYLRATGRPQIYGTQFVDEGGVMRQGAFDRAFLPDAVRAATNVPSLSEQAAPIRP